MRFWPTLRKSYAHTHTYTHRHTHTHTHTHTGMPIWYTPPPSMDHFLMFILKMSKQPHPQGGLSPPLTIRSPQLSSPTQQQQQQVGRYVERGRAMSTSNSLQSPHTQERQQLQGSGEGKAAQRPQALLALPQCQEAHAHAGVQQLLQFFGYEWWVHVNKVKRHTHMLKCSSCFSSLATSCGCM